MDRRAFALGVAAVGFSGPALAAAAVTGPDYIGIFAGLSGNKLIDLERQPAAFKSKLKGMGYGGADIYYEMQGASSPVRFTVATVPGFIVRAPQDQDPQTQFGFYQLTIVKNTRRLTTGKVNPMGFGTRTTASQFSVPFNAVKYGGDFFKITPATPLGPGEYGFMTTAGTQAGAGGFGGAGNQPVFLFGVD